MALLFFQSASEDLPHPRDPEQMVMATTTVRRQVQCPPWSRLPLPSLPFQEFRTCWQGLVDEDSFSANAEDLDRRAVAQPWTRNSIKLFGMNDPAPNSLSTTLQESFFSKPRVPGGCFLDLGLYGRFSAYKALDVFCRVRP